MRRFVMTIIENWVRSGLLLLFVVCTMWWKSCCTLLNPWHVGDLETESSFMMFVFKSYLIVFYCKKSRFHEEVIIISHGFMSNQTVSYDMTPVFYSMVSFYPTYFYECIVRLRSLTTWRWNMFLVSLWHDWIIIQLTPTCHLCYTDSFVAYFWAVDIITEIMILIYGD